MCVPGTIEICHRDLSPFAEDPSDTGPGLEPEAVPSDHDRASSKVSIELPEDQPSISRYVSIRHESDDLVGSNWQSDMLSSYDHE